MMRTLQHAANLQKKPGNFRYVAKNLSACEVEETGRSGYVARQQ